MGRKELALPYLDSSLQLGQVEVPTEIGHYIATGLKCLENNGQRWNFTCKVIDWMQNDLVYQIVRTPTCIQGFGGILPFIVSIKDFSNYLRGKLVVNSLHSKSFLVSCYNGLADAISEASTLILFFIFIFACKLLFYKGHFSVIHFNLCLLFAQLSSQNFIIFSRKFEQL